MAAAPFRPGDGDAAALALGVLLAAPGLSRADSAAYRRKADEMRALHVPGAAVAVVRGGKVDGVQGSGVRR